MLEQFEPGQHVALGTAGSVRINRAMIFGVPGSDVWCVPGICYDTRERRHFEIVETMCVRAIYGWHRGRNLNGFVKLVWREDWL